MPFYTKKKKIVWVFLSQHRITLLLPLSLSFSCLLTIHSYQQWPEERVQSVKPAAKSLQLCPTLCNPKDCSPPGSYVQEILQARILEWVAMPSFRGSSQPRDQTHVSCFGRRFFITSTTLVPQPRIRPMHPCCESAILTTRPPGRTLLHAL